MPAPAASPRRAVSASPRRSVFAGPRRTGGTKVFLAVALLLPYAGLCFPGLYARATPALLGFPFFYWYQFASVVLTSILLYSVYRALKAR